MDNMELERKFLVRDKVPNGHQLLSCSQISQFYLYVGSNNDEELRFRKRVDLTGEYYTLTYKRINYELGQSLMLLPREEIEVSISSDMFHELLKDSYPLNKTRYVILYNDYQISVDIYPEGILPDGHTMIAEIEFDSVESSADFEPPLWFGHEVTRLDDYRNCIIWLRNYMLDQNIKN